MTSRQISRAIVGDHLIHVLARSIGEEIVEQVVQMATDIRPQELLGDIALSCLAEDALYCAANVRSGVEQSPIYVE
jgi:hypothetical protein